MEINYCVNYAFTDKAGRERSYIKEFDTAEKAVKFARKRSAHDKSVWIKGVYKKVREQRPDYTDERGVIHPGGGITKCAFIDWRTND